MSEQSTVNAESAEPKTPHLNVPVSQAFADKLAAYVAEQSMPIGAANGATGRPSVAYVVMGLLAKPIGYTLTDDDRTSGRQSLSDEERALNKALKSADTRKAMLAALKAAGITL